MLHTTRHVTLSVVATIASIAIACNTNPKPEKDTEGTSGSQESSTSGNSIPTMVIDVPMTSTDTLATTSGSTCGSCGDDLSSGGTPSDFGTLDCDLQTQNCPAGQKCSPYANEAGSFWNDTRCVPLVEPLAHVGDPCLVEGEPLSGVDNCGIGELCWDGDGQGTFCAPLCSGPLDEPTCPDGRFCSVFSENLAICETIACDPLLQNCPQEEDVCIPNMRLDDDWCLPDESGATGKLHDPCESDNSCDKGLVCVAQNIAAEECIKEFEGCCQPFCEVGIDSCSGAGQECLPYYQISDVGVCQLPS